MRILGLDVGTKNIGVAVSDETGTIAQAREVIKRGSDESAIKRIVEIVVEFGVEEMVVGYPFNLDGTIGKSADAVTGFAEKLKKAVSVPVKLWDERLSTKEAEDILLSADMTRGKRKQVIDKLAAQIILQNYLDARNRED